VELASLNFQVVIDPTVPPLVKDSVSYETGASVEESASPWVYEHHGEGFDPLGPGALTRFYEDLIRGTPLPLIFSTREVNDIDSIVAITLFLSRDLATHPATPGFVTAVDLVHRFGPQYLGHVDPDLARFFQGLRGYFPPGVSRQEAGQRVGTAVQWIREYILDGDLPNIGPRVTSPRVLEIGTNGFVFAEAAKPSIETWGELYRGGFLRGVLIGPQLGDFRQVIASRKSDRVEFNLNQALIHLNELERASDGDPTWRIEGDFLFSPPQGTLILMSYLLGVFIRV